jgi:seryl-tRNA synthetase
MVFPGTPPPPPAGSGSSPSGPSTTSTKPSHQSSSSAPPKTTSLLAKPRLDYATLLADPAQTAHNAMIRNSPLPHGPNHLPHMIRLRDTQLLLLQKISNVRSKQKEVSQLIKANLGDKDELVRQAKKLKGRITDYETNLNATEEELLELGLVLPNVSMADVPLGPEENAVEIERFGPEPIPSDLARDHLRTTNWYELLDNEASTISTGSSWPYLRGTLALLEMALINYATSICLKHGYEPVIPPDIIRTDIASRCGFNPRDGDGDAAPTQTYHIAGTDLCLAGTAEIPLSALFANRILEHKSLPRKVVGVGHAFRAEAGARGSDTRGLYRVHQFTKVEMFCVTSADGEGGEVMEEMRSVQREIAEGLGLSVRYVARHDFSVLG